MKYLLEKKKNMNAQFVCELYFEKAKVNQEELLKLAVSSFGFTPKVMSIYISLDEFYEEVSYDEDFLLSVLLREKDLGITIRDFDDINKISTWFKIGKIEGNFFSIGWSNEYMDFLLNDKLTNFLKIDGFAAGFVFNNKDVWEQSRMAKDNKSNSSNDYPGQFKYVCGMQFMAAPLMWFSDSFFGIISKSKLMSFSHAHAYKAFSNIVEINLFDIYDIPAKEENREKQKQFWTFMELDKVAMKYEEDNSIDAAQALFDFLKKRKSK